MRSPLSNMQKILTTDSSCRVTQILAHLVPLLHRYQPIIVITLSRLYFCYMLQVLEIPG